MKKTLSSLVVIFIIVSSSLLYLVGSTLINRVNYDLFLPPKESISVNLKTTDGNISGTLYIGELDKPIISLFHPLGGSQKSMQSRVELFKSVGYGVMTIDFNAHGQSSGEYNTFGHLESKNVREVHKYLKTKFPKRKIGAIGVSLGGASILLSDVKFDAIIIEETYADISTAIGNRLSMKFGNWAKSLSWMLTSQLPLRLNINSEMLRPESSINTVTSPIFIIGGEVDERATIEETMRLYNSISSTTIKDLWIVKNAHHTNFHTFAKKEYEKKVLFFFAKYL